MFKGKLNYTLYSRLVMNGPNKLVLVLEQSSVIYLCKDKPTLEESSNQVGSDLTRKHYTKQ
jgi:hypothetical protein